MLLFPVGMLLCMLPGGMLHGGMLLGMLPGMLADMLPGGMVPGMEPGGMLGGMLLIMPGIPLPCGMLFDMLCGIL